MSVGMASHRRRSIRSAAVALLAVLACTTPPPEMLELSAVAVDGNPRDLVLNRGLIESISPSEMDADGQAMPGLFFLWNDSAMPTPLDLVALVDLGFTSLLLVDRDMADSLAVRDYVGTSRDRGPRVYISGPEIGKGLEDNSPAFALRIDDLSATGADFILVDANRGAERVCEVVDEAKRRGVLTWVRTAQATPAGLVERCPPTTVWLTGSAPPARATGAKTVWLSLNPNLGDASPIALPADGFPNAALDPERHAHGVARALGLGDAVGRVAPGYVADLVVLGHADTATQVYIDGVLQAPRVPWLAQWLIEFERFRHRVGLPQTLRP